MRFTIFELWILTVAAAVVIAVWKLREPAIFIYVGPVLIAWSLALRPEILTRVRAAGIGLGCLLFVGALALFAFAVVMRLLEFG